METETSATARHHTPLRVSYSTCKVGFAPSTVQNGCCSRRHTKPPPRTRGPRANATRDARARDAQMHARQCMRAIAMRWSLYHRKRLHHRSLGEPVTRAHTRVVARNQARVIVSARTRMHAAGARQPHAKQSQRTHLPGHAVDSCRVDRPPWPLVDGRGRWLCLRLTSAHLSGPAAREARRDRTTREQRGPLLFSSTAVPLQAK